MSGPQAARPMNRVAPATKTFIRRSSRICCRARRGRAQPEGRSRKGPKKGLDLLGWREVLIIDRPCLPARRPVAAATPLRAPPNLLLNLLLAVKADFRTPGSVRQHLRAQSKSEGKSYLISATSDIRKKHSGSPMTGAIDNACRDRTSSGLRKALPERNRGCSLDSPPTTIDLSSRGGRLENAEITSRSCAVKAL
jgi:hypothetical protein